MNEKTKEWVQANRQQNLEVKAKWWAEHKGEILAKRRDEYKENEEFKEIMLKRNKEYHDNNKEKIREANNRLNVDIKCPCGREYKRYGHSRHLKTQMHQAYEQNKTEKSV